MPLPFYAEQGAGDTAVFLLHGVGGGNQVWAQTLPVFAAHGYRCIAWDAPGYGQSAMPPSQPDGQGGYTTAALARALHQLIDHVGAKRNLLVGHSMGGMVLQEALAQNSQNIHGLILFATSPAFGKPGGDWQQQFLQSRFKPLDSGLGMAGLAPGLVQAMVAPGAAPEAINAAIATMSQVPEATYRAALSAIVSFNQLGNLADIQIPTLCLSGEFDKNAAPEVMEKMAARIPGAQYVCQRGVGHLGNLENPETFNAHVLDFLQQHFPTRI